MRYRDARLLHEGDEVIRKSNNGVYTIKSLEIYGQNKVVRLNCVDLNNALVTLYHDEVK